MPSYICNRKDRREHWRCIRLKGHDGACSPFTVFDPNFLRQMLKNELDSLAALCLKEGRAVMEPGGEVATFDIRRALERIDNLTGELAAAAELAREAAAETPAE
jgi:hypothetical protein